MKCLISIIFCLSFSAGYAQDCSSVIRDTAIVTGLMRHFQDVATLATVNNTSTLYNLWAEKRENGFYFKAEKVGVPDYTVAIGSRSEGRSYIEFIFADTSIHYYISSDWQWTQRYNFEITTPALLQKLATQPLIALKGFSEQPVVDATAKKSRSRSPKLKFVQESSFTFTTEEATKMVQAFQCLRSTLVASSRSK